MGDSFIINELNFVENSKNLYKFYSIVLNCNKIISAEQLNLELSRRVNININELTADRYWQD